MKDQQKLKAIFDGANLGISIIDSEEGKYIMANDWWLMFLRIIPTGNDTLIILKSNMPEDQAQKCRINSSYQWRN